MKISIIKLWFHELPCTSWDRLYENYIIKYLLWQFLDTHLSSCSLHSKLLLQFAFLVRSWSWKLRFSLVFKILFIFKKFQHLSILFFNQGIHISLDLFFSISTTTTTVLSLFMLSVLFRFMSGYPWIFILFRRDHTNGLGWLFGQTFQQLIWINFALLDFL